MSRPIKDTPILYGDDAKRFLDAIENLTPATDEERARVKKAYEKLKEIATFSM